MVVVTDAGVKVKEAAVVAETGAAAAAALEMEVEMARAEGLGVARTAGMDTTLETKAKSGMPCLGPVHSD